MFGTIAVVGIIIDAAASTVSIDDGDVRTWLADQRVFISSVMGGMTDLRHAVAEAVTRAGAQPVYFEQFGGRADDAEAAYLGEVAASTIYLGVLGQSYGRMQPSRLSATHEEFREADQRNLTVSAWAQTGVSLDGDQRAFLDEVRLFHTTGTYSGIDDLAASVTRRLNEMAAEDLSPWVLLGALMFRARHIRDDGKTIAIEATIRNPAVASALEAMRPSTWSYKDVRLTYNGRAQMVRIKSVHTSTSSRTATAFTIACEATVDPDAGTPLVSINLPERSLSPGQVTEALVKRALFGKAVPGGILALGGRVDPPRERVPDEAVSDDLQRAVLRLLITEALVRSGRISRVLRLDISPEGADGRTVELTFETPGAGNGEPPRRVHGRLNLTPKPQ